MITVTQIVFLGLVFLFSGFVAYLNYRVELDLIKQGRYKKYYGRGSDIKFGLMLIAIGSATGVSLAVTGQINTSANLGFFIPAFAGITLVITAFIDDDKGLGMNLFEKKK